MPVYRFRFTGPSQAKIQQECPDFTIIANSPTPEITRDIEVDSADALGALVDFHDAQGWEYVQEVTP